MERILTTIRSFDSVLELAPAEGSGFPEIAWGDHFFYFAADGKVPQNEQPYATIIKKDHPDDAQSALAPMDRWRLNIHAGRERFVELIGEKPREFAQRDFSESDVIMPHPVYSALGWIAVVNPGDRTMPTVVELLRDAHDDARRRAARRAADQEN